MRNKRRGKTGRCGERTERCRWQRKRSERVAAVKIGGVRRKAAQKFWAPQQDHRPLRKRTLRCVGEGLCPSHGRGRTPPLRKRYKRCNGRATARVAPTKSLQEARQNGPMWASAPTEGTGCTERRDFIGVFKFVKKLSCLFGAVAVQCFRRFFASKFALHPG